MLGVCRTSSTSNHRTVSSSPPTTGPAPARRSSSPTAAGRRGTRGAERPKRSPGRGTGSCRWTCAVTAIPPGRPDRDYTMDAFRDDALAVADWVGEPVAWVGASLGGMTGLHAVHRPARRRSTRSCSSTSPRARADRRQPDPRVHGRQRRGGFRHPRRRRRRDRRRTSRIGRDRRTCRGWPRTCGSATTDAGAGTGTQASSTSAPAARASTPATPITMR